MFQAAQGSRFLACRVIVIGLYFDVRPILCCTTMLKTYIFNLAQKGFCEGYFVTPHRVEGLRAF